MIPDTRPQYTVTENQGPAIIEIILNRPADQQIQVDYATDRNNARPGDDYIDAGGTLVFAPGDERKIFEITIVNDDEQEPAETIILTLKNPSPGVNIETAIAELIITDDD